MIKVLVCLVSTCIGVHLNPFASKSTSEYEAKLGYVAVAKDILISTSSLYPHPVSPCSDACKSFIKVRPHETHCRHQRPPCSDWRAMGIQNIRMRWKVIAWIGAEKTLPHYSCISGRRQACIVDVRLQNDTSLSLQELKTGLRGDQVSSELFFSYVAGHLHRICGGFCRSDSKKQSANKQNRADTDKPSLGISVVTHFLRSAVHGPRRFVHSLLGDQVINLALAGFLFAALAGVGGGLILDNFDGKRRHVRLGWGLLSFSLPLFIACLLLGLP